MFLPKPNVLTVPSCSAPVGIGLEACNSGNSCNGQSCDANSGSSSCDSLGWTVVGTVATIVGAAATAAG